MTIDYSTLYIGGKWVEPATAATISVHSPTTEELIGSVPEAAEADIDKAVDAAGVSLISAVPSSCTVSWPTN